MRIALPELFSAVVSSYDPGVLVREHFSLHPVEGGDLTVLALGKAAVPMMCGARAALGDAICEEVVVAPSLPAESPKGWFASTHPSPSSQSERAARALLEAAVRARGRVVALISGGGSALAALPAAGLSLEDKSALVGKVYAAGADIFELNVVRKHLSAFKGGRLAAACPQPVYTLVLSDVLGDSLSAVASGPTVPDLSAYAQALQVVERYCSDEVSGAAVEHLRAGVLGHREETLKSTRLGDEAQLLSGMRGFLKFVENRAAAMGANVEAMPELMQGAVESVAASLAERLRTAPPEPALWVFGGEATIALPSSPGRGGRAQHLALLMAEQIAGRKDLQILIAGSDGVDGNSNAAGALVDGTSWTAIQAAGIDPRAALLACDSAGALAAIGAQIVTGATGVNHADLVFVQFS